MIDALAALLRLAESDAALALLVEGRIAAKHKYGMDGDDPLAWPERSKAMLLTYDPGGIPDLRVRWSTHRLQALCYGASQEECSAVYQALIDVTRSDVRRRVDMGDGTYALVYYLVPDGSPVFVFDPDLEIDALQLFLRAAVAEEDVP